jgi:hypothetical protein
MHRAPTILVLIAAAAACGGPEGGTPLLDARHKGWQQTNCVACHALPVEGHSTAFVPQCASCHGANGACQPNGPNSKNRSHRSTDFCSTCHPVKHEGYKVREQCVACHFAAAGTIACP